MIVFQQLCRCNVSIIQNVGGKRLGGGGLFEKQPLANECVRVMDTRGSLSEVILNEYCFILGGGGPYGMCNEQILFMGE